MENPEYSPEITDALIDAIPENVYDPCPCGCGKKWRFVVKSKEAIEHIKKFCDDKNTLDSTH